jgi:hypothetical protein
LNPLSGDELRYDAEIQIALDKLLLIENKAGFDLGIKLSQRKIQLNTWLHAFAQLKPILDAFEKEGADVRIFWMYDMDHEHVDVECNELIKNHGPDWKEDVITFLDTVGHFLVQTRLHGTCRLSNISSNPRSRNATGCISSKTIRVLIRGLFKPR